MFFFLSSCFTGCKFKKNNNKASNYIARDDLDVTHKKVVTKGITQHGSNRDMKHASPCDNQNRGTVRVKVIMSKEEAMVLFSKCDRGSGTLTFKNVAKELTKIPVSRVSLVHDPWSPNNKVMLESIPEEP